LWLRRSRTQLKWPREVSKLKAKKIPEEDSRTTKLEEAVEIAEAEAEVDLATLPMATERNNAQELKVEKEEAELAVEEEETVPLAKKGKRLQILARKVRENHSKESQEKVPILTIADQEPAVERETNKSLEVAVDNGVIQSKTRTKKSLKKRTRKNQLKKSLLKKLRLKNLSQLSKKNLMST